MKRNIKSLIAETILPIAFICLGIFLLNFAPKIGNKLPLELHPWHQRTSSENRIFFKSSDPSPLSRSIWTSLVTNGPGLRCNHALYQISADDDSSPGQPLECDKNRHSILHSSLKKLNSTSLKPRICDCQNGFPSCDRDLSSHKVESHRLPTRDIIYKLNEDVETWIMDTEFGEEFFMNRYGGFEFVESSEATRVFYSNLTQLTRSFIELVEAIDPQKTNIVDKYRDILTQKWIPTRHVKIWYNNKGMNKLKERIYYEIYLLFLSIKFKKKSKLN